MPLDENDSAKWQNSILWVIGKSVPTFIAVSRKVTHRPIKYITFIKCPSQGSSVSQHLYDQTLELPWLNGQESSLMFAGLMCQNVYS